MTIHLALDPVTGHDQTAAGVIRAINPTAAGIAAAGFAVADGYTADRLVTIDETDDSVWNDDCEPGWFWVNGVVNQARPLTLTERVAVGKMRLKEAVERENEEWQIVVAEENFAPHTDSGHAWSDDLRHALLIPNIRHQVVLWTDAEADPTEQKVSTAETALEFFEAAANYGVRNIYRNGLKPTWRPLRLGGRAYGYDIATGGIRTGVSFAVTYPAGETVATWDALAAVRSL